MSAGVTRTVSTAVIVFELTGELSYLLPGKDSKESLRSSLFNESREY